MTRKDHEARAPAAFILDDDKPAAKPARKAEAKAKPQRAPRAITDIVFAPEETQGDLVTVPRAAVIPARRSFRWGGLLLSALSALIALGAGLAITNLIDNAFAHAPWLGYTALGLASLVGLSALAIIIREIWGLWRLARIEHIQAAAARAINQDDATAADETVRELTVIYGHRADTRWGLDRLADHRDDIMDPKDRVRLAERLLIDPLDAEAHRIIARRARRVTLLTTVTPIAALDVLFVGVQNFAMLRELATLYGGRPSTLSTFRLARLVVAHLAISGGLALSDNLLQHLVGKGLMGRLSARFGEGAVNGILTSRIGIAASAVCRPVPRVAEARDTLASLLRELVTFGDRTEGKDGNERNPNS
jgi:putative membrane protein